MFEAEKWRRVDPGLVEWAKVNCFHTRVFPIPAGGQRIVLGPYVSELGGEKPVYRLPLDFDRPVPFFSLRIEVVKPAVRPELREADLRDFDFKAWQESFVAETKLENAVLNKDLVIALPHVERQNVWIEKDEDGEVYFAVHDRPARPTPEPPSAPKHVVLFRDASGLRGRTDRTREIGLLRALLAAWTAPAGATSRR